MTSTLLFLSIAGTSAIAADSPAPTDFVGVPLGSTLGELRSKYPQVSRNPDSDKHFQVYQVPTLRGVEVASPAAFEIYQGQVVGGQILLDSHNAHYWLDTMTSRYGEPDSCTYCNDAELTNAIWRWPNGTRLTIEGEMLTELTSDGATQRNAWLQRDDTNEIADSGDETTNEPAPSPPPKPPKHRHHHASRANHALASAAAPGRSEAREPGFRGAYSELNDRLERWLGWRK